MSKKHNLINLDKASSLQQLRSQVHRPLIVLGSGPSANKIDYKRVPKDPIIFRTNCFFFEENYVMGKQVDAVMVSVYRSIFLDYLYDALKAGEYEVSLFLHPFEINQGEPQRAKVNTLCRGLFQPSFDHWAIMATVPEFARAMMARPLPTQGIQALATGVALGFREIYVAGIDFYQSTDQRYAYTFEDEAKKLLTSKHLKPGYEKGLHNLETDLSFFELIRKRFPETHFASLSENSYFTKLTQIADVVDTKQYQREPKPNRKRQHFGQVSQIKSPGKHAAIETINSSVRVLSKIPGMSGFFKHLKSAIEEARKD